MGYSFGKMAQLIANEDITTTAIVTETFLGFQHGLRTSLPASMLAETELAECINFQINRGGQLQSRAGLKKLNTTTLGKIISLGSGNIDDEAYNIAQSADFVLHRVKADGSTTTLGTAEAKARMVSYGGKVVVADGGYLKYIDSDDTLKIVWDGGTPGFFDNRGDSLVGSVDYTAAQTTKVPFTTPSWPSGYTIPLTKIEVKVGRMGTGGTGAVTIGVYRTSDDVLMASGDLEELASEVAPDPGDFSTAYLTVVNELAPSTAYYVSLSMTAYDVTNYIKWYTGTSNIPICGVSPGLPPKGAAIAVHNKQLWLYHDPSALGTIYFNNYALFDWSTPGYAGYLTTMDANKDSYPIGAVVEYYGNLFIYGTEEFSYLLQLTGTSYDDFALSDLSQPLWSKPDMVQEILNDVWALNRGGISSLTGVNMYGDVRTYSESFAIDDIVEALWSDSAFTGYYVDRGQLFVAVGTRVFVANTKAPTEGLNRIRYPWSEYTFNFTPSAMGQWNDLVIGSEEGFVYTPDDGLTKDDGMAYDLSIKLRNYQSPFMLIDVLEAKVMLDSKSGSSFDFVAYKDNATTDEVYRWPMSSSLHDDVTIDNLGDATIDDINSMLTTIGNPKVLRLGFTCFAYQAAIESITSIGLPVFIDGIVIRYRPMED